MGAKSHHRRVLVSLHQSVITFHWVRLLKRTRYCLKGYDRALNFQWVVR